MTFFEWIRHCLRWDAKQHPMPEKQKLALRCRVRGIRDEETKAKTEDKTD